MYLPEVFTERDAQRLFRFIDSHPFGLLVHTAGEAVSIDPVPFLADAAEGALWFHLAKANALSRVLKNADGVTVVFQGPHAYVSPRWYDAPGVPTWNYLVVQVAGRIQSLDPADTAGLMQRFLRHFESESASPLNLPDEQRLQSIMKNIAGYRLEVTDIVGKFKMSQNRPLSDVDNVIARLVSSGDSQHRVLAEYMQSWLDEKQ